MFRGRTMSRSPSRRRSRSSSSRYGGTKRILTYMADAAAQTLPYAYNYFTGTDTKSGGVVTTGQHDYQRQYRYKKASRRVRRRARRTYKRFVKNSLKLVGSNTVIKNQSTTTTTSATTPQAMTVVHVGGLTGTEFGGNDINSIVSNDARVSTSGKVLIQNGNLDITMRNNSADSNVSLEVDVYELVYNNQTKKPSFGSLLSDAWTETPAIGSMTSFTINDRGTQLFDFPLMSKKGVKIIKKTKVFLPAGNTATYRLKLKRNQWINPSEDLIDNVGYIKPYYTRSVAIVFKPVVGTGDVSSLIVGNTRKYIYKIFEDDTSRDAILP